MKKCDFFDYIKVFVFSPEELSEDEYNKIQEHIKVCEVCNKEFEYLNFIMQNIKEDNIEFPQEEFFEQLPAHILNNITINSHNRKHVIKPIAVLASFIIIAVASYFVFNIRNDKANLDLYFYDILGATTIDNNLFYFDDFAYSIDDIDTTYLDIDFTDDDISLIEKNLDKIHILDDK